LWEAGQNSNYWVDPRGATLSTHYRELMLTLDVDDVTENDTRGYGESDWIHSYQYIVPSNQAMLADKDLLNTVQSVDLNIPDADLDVNYLEEHVFTNPFIDRFIIDNEKKTSCV
jgi:hypothetical protein